MPKSKIAVELCLDSDTDPPSAVIVVSANGPVIATKTLDSATREYMALVRAVQDATGVDLSGELAPAIEGIITELDERQSREEELRARRAQSRADWLAAKEALRPKP